MKFSSSINFAETNADRLVSVFCCAFFQAPPKLEAGHHEPSGRRSYCFISFAFRDFHTTSSLVAAPIQATSGLPSPFKSATAPAGAIPCHRNLAAQLIPLDRLLNRCRPSPCPRYPAMIISTVPIQVAVSGT
jgi:hypothetical protein